MAQDKGRDDDVTVIGRYESNIDANILKGVLEANGVTADVIGDSTAGALFMGLPTGNWRLVVRKSDAGLAKRILESAPEAISGDEQDTD